MQSISRTYSMWRELVVTLQAVDIFVNSKLYELVTQLRKSSAAVILRASMGISLSRTTVGHGAWASTSGQGLSLDGLTKPASIVPRWTCGCPEAGRQQWPSHTSHILLAVVHY
jgi:hypothetical protein